MDKTQQKSILWGVCGIGGGHSIRQMPLIAHYADHHNIMIFAYGESLRIMRDTFGSHPHIRIAEVAVPYYIGTQMGLDFAATAAHPANQNVDFSGINTAAMAQAQGFVGTPDLVVTDYEPVAAQYGYATGARVVTLDQQSKYLIGDFAKDLNGTGFADEVQRLKMFFPAAYKRLACSFFNVVARGDAAETVEIVPPVLRDDVVRLTRNIGDGRDVLIYMSAQMKTQQNLSSVLAACRGCPEWRFHMFGVNGDDAAAADGAENVRIYQPDNKAFLNMLAKSAAIISTAGHGLLSEAMMLGIPVYAMPLPLYEQQMNAKIIQDHGFGVAASGIDAGGLRSFLQRNDDYAAAIRSDRHILLRRDGKAEIVQHLDRALRLRR